MASPQWMTVRTPRSRISATARRTRSVRLCVSETMAIFMSVRRGWDERRNDLPS